MTSPRSTIRGKSFFDSAETGFELSDQPRYSVVRPSKMFNPMLSKGTFISVYCSGKFITFGFSDRAERITSVDYERSNTENVIPRESNESKKPFRRPFKLKRKTDTSTRSEFSLLCTLFVRHFECVIGMNEK